MTYVVTDASGSVVARFLSPDAAVGRAKAVGGVAIAKSPKSDVVRLFRAEAPVYAILDAAEEAGYPDADRLRHAWSTLQRTQPDAVAAARHFRSSPLGFALRTWAATPEGGFRVGDTVYLQRGPGMGRVTGLCRVVEVGRPHGEGMGLYYRIRNDAGRVSDWVHGSWLRDSK